MSLYKLSILCSLFSLSVAIDDIKVVSVVLKESNLNLRTYWYPKVSLTETEQVASQVLYATKQVSSFTDS